MSFPASERLLVEEGARDRADVHDVQIGQVLEQHVRAVDAADVHVTGEERAQLAVRLLAHGGEQPLAARQKEEIARHPRAPARAHPPHAAARRQSATRSAAVGGDDAASPSSPPLARVRLPARGAALAGRALRRGRRAAVGVGVVGGGVGVGGGGGGGRRGRRATADILL